MTAASHTASPAVVEGIYLFCFARRDSLPAIQSPSPDDQHAISQWGFKNVVAVFCPVPLEPWIGPTAEENLRNLHWVAPRACRHEAVVEQVMSSSPVLPVRFGTLFSSLLSLEQLLYRHYGRISAFLDYVADKEEWAAKGVLDRSRAEEHLLASRVPAPTLPSSPGARYLLEQRLRAEVRQNLHSWIETVVANLTRLQDDAVDFRPLRVLRQATPGSDQQVVLNWAFLLSQSAREAFRAQVERISAPYAAQGLVVELSGPWPPYNFCPSLGAGK